MSYGFIYCLGNEAMPGIYKIGMTERAPSQRCLELSGSTSAPLPFDLLFYGEVENPSQIEREIHEHFYLERVNESREFFRGSAHDFHTAIDEWCGSVATTCMGSYYLSVEAQMHGIASADTDAGRVKAFIDLAGISGVHLWAEGGMVRFSCPKSLIPHWVYATAATSKSILIAHLPTECPTKTKSALALVVPA